MVLQGFFLTDHKLKKDISVKVVKGHRQQRDILFLLSKFKIRLSCVQRPKWAESCWLDNSKKSGWKKKKKTF